MRQNDRIWMWNKSAVSGAKEMNDNSRHTPRKNYQKTQHIICISGICIWNNPRNPDGNTEPFGMRMVAQRNLEGELFLCLV